jgi:hypothetical protein
MTKPLVVTQSERRTIGTALGRDSSFDQIRNLASFIGGRMESYPDVNLVAGQLGIDFSQVRNPQAWLDALDRAVAA